MRSCHLRQRSAGSCRLDSRTSDQMAAAQMLGKEPATLRMDQLGCLPAAPTGLWFWAGRPIILKHTFPILCCTVKWRAMTVTQRSQLTNAVKLEENVKYGFIELTIEKYNLIKIVKRKNIINIHLMGRRSFKSLDMDFAVATRARAVSWRGRVLKPVCVSAALGINLRRARDEMLPCVFPNKQGSAHMHVEWADDPLLGDFHAHVQHLKQIGRYAFTLIPDKQRKSEKSEMRRTIRWPLSLITTETFAAPKPAVFFESF